MLFRSVYHSQAGGAGGGGGSPTPPFLSWVDGNPGGTIVTGNGYIVSAGTPTWSLPATAAVGDVFGFILTENADGAVAFSISISVGQQIKAATQTTSAGAGTKLTVNPAGIGRGQTLLAVCTVANTNWQIFSGVGALNLT